MSSEDGVRQDVQGSPRWARSEAHACQMWSRECGCLASPTGADSPAEHLANLPDVCTAAYALARSLRSRCAMDRQTREGCSCPPLDALEQLVRWIGDRPARLGAAEDEKSCERLSLSDLVHQAVPIQTSGPSEELCTSLIRALASAGQPRPLLGAEQSHLWHG